MSYEDVENVLRKALTLYAQQGPEKQKEIQEALDVLLETMSRASALVSECQQAIQECLVALNDCHQIATLQTF
jgi:hypothetical protein